jgi:hypothetical protein
MVKEPNMNHDAIKQYLDEMQQHHLLQVSAQIRANEQQVGGAHYAVKAIQPWDFIIANDIGYLEGNIIKYISRWKDKGGVEDLKKAQHYLQKLIETHDKERVV